MIEDLVWPLVWFISAVDNQYCLVKHLTLIFCWKYYCKVYPIHGKCHKCYDTGGEIGFSYCVCYRYSLRELTQMRFVIHTYYYICKRSDRCTAFN